MTLASCMMGQRFSFCPGAPMCIFFQHCANVTVHCFKDSALSPVAMQLSVSVWANRFKRSVPSLHMQTRQCSCLFCLDHLTMAIGCPLGKFTLFCSTVNILKIYSILIYTFLFVNLFIHTILYHLCCYGDGAVWLPLLQLLNF